MAVTHQKTEPAGQHSPEVLQAICQSQSRMARGDQDVARLMRLANDPLQLSAFLGQGPVGRSRLLYDDSDMALLCALRLNGLAVSKWKGDFAIQLHGYSSVETGEPASLHPFRFEPVLAEHGVTLEGEFLSDPRDIETASSLQGGWSGLRWTAAMAASAAVLLLVLV